MNHQTPQTLALQTVEDAAEILQATAEAILDSIAVVRATLAETNCDVPTT